MMRLQTIHLFDLKASDIALVFKKHFRPTYPTIKPRQIGHFVTRSLNYMLIPIKQVTNPAGIICNVPRLLVFFVIGAKLNPFVNAAEGFNETLLPALAENCIKCHGKDDKIKGDLNLFEFRRFTEYPPPYSGSHRRTRIRRNAARGRTSSFGGVETEDNR